MADATSTFNEISGGLDGLASQVVSVIPDDRALMEIWGWNMPGAGRNDLADYVRHPKEIIQKIIDKNVSDADLLRLQLFPPRIKFISENVIQHFAGGNAFHAYIVLESFIDSLLLILERYNPPTFNFEEIKDRRILPAQQLRTLRRISQAVDFLGVESQTLESKIATINSAHEVAESLPADLQTLEDARKKFQIAEREIDNSLVSISKKQAEIEELRERLAAADNEAKSVLLRANAAYSAATTVGLGKAFSERAASLSKSTFFLGVILVFALGAGAYITFVRVEFVHKLMLTPKIGYNILWLNLTFTALSVSGPVWLAWLLTKQIGQRFRLAEDYGYKATVARAYEGYRAEAAQIDTELQRRLFSIALDTLGEAPLRLVEKESPGSPVHEAQSTMGRSFLGRMLSPGRAPNQPNQLAEKID